MDIININSLAIIPNQSTQIPTSETVDNCTILFGEQNSKTTNNDSLKDKDLTIASLVIPIPIYNCNILPETTTLNIKNPDITINYNDTHQILDKNSDFETNINSQDNINLFNEYDINQSNQLPFHTEGFFQEEQHNHINNKLTNSFPKIKQYEDSNGPENINTDHIVGKNEQPILQKNTELDQVDLEKTNINDNVETITHEINNTNIQHVQNIKRDSLHYKPLPKRAQFNISDNKKLIICNEHDTFDVNWEFADMTTETKQVVLVPQEQNMKLTEASYSQEIQSFETKNNSALPVTPPEKLKFIANTSDKNYTNLDQIESYSRFHQVQMKIVQTHDAQSDTQKITIQLYPQELGNLEVKICLNDKHNQHNNIVYVFIEKPQTLELFKQDIQSLEQNLQNLGVLSDSTNINLSLEYSGSGMYKHYNANENLEHQPQYDNSLYKQLEVQKTLPIHRYNNRQLDIVV